METGILASCHCGKVAIRLDRAPTQITHCNCSLCRRYGVLWAYYPISSVRLPDAAGLTHAYAWGGRNVDFHRCADCGCVAYWLPRDPQRERMGINARLLDPVILGAVPVRRKDSAGTGLFY